MPRKRIRAAAACLLCVLTAAGAEGTVEVSFVEPLRFSDVGLSPSVRDRNLKTLADFCTRLGTERLASGQRLKLEVLDVDLAGEERFGFHPSELRIARGGADWPRIRLRYVFEQGGKAIRQGEARIADLDYLGHSLVDSSRDPLRHEKRMLQRWFDTEITPHGAIAATAHGAP